MNLEEQGECHGEEKRGPGELGECHGGESTEITVGSKTWINEKRSVAREALERKKRELIEKKEIKDKIWELAKTCKEIIKKFESD